MSDKRISIDTGSQASPKDQFHVNYDLSLGEGDPNYKLNQKRKKWVILTCGILLFSEGYCANSIGAVLTILKKLYPVETSSSSAIQNISSFSFIGTVIGMISFGFVSDYMGRKWGMLIATALLIIFSALCASAVGANGSINGMLTALAIYRLLLGIGIGAEYPTGSCAAAEATAELQKGRRHGYFVMVTDLMINFGFVLGIFTPFILTLILKESRLNIVWRLCIGLGVIVPIFIFYARLKLKDPVAYRKNAVKFKDTPYLLSLKRYWPRVCALSLVWFIYNFSTYAFSMYSSIILDTILGDEAPLAKAFGFSLLITSFYVPGSVIGIIFVDMINPKYLLCIGLAVQAIIGIFLAGFYVKLTETIPLFCALYGVFLAFGEFGPGNNLGLLCSKSCASPIRGQFYAFIAAFGKVGGFVGTYAFIAIQKAFGEGVQGQRGPFFVASVFNILAAVIGFLFVPKLSQNCIEDEDTAFRLYLHENGYDVLQNLGFEEEKPLIHVIDEIPNLR